jgi:predicted nucleotidyltransferase
MVLRRNGYVMEQIFSPLIVTGGPQLEELRDIARRWLTRNLLHYYRGFLANQLELLAKESPKRVKTLLYAYRVALTGIHVLAAGAIESNLPGLCEQDGQETRRCKPRVEPTTRSRVPISCGSCMATFTLLATTRC